MSSPSRDCVKYAFWRRVLKRAAISVRSHGRESICSVLVGDCAAQRREVQLWLVGDATTVLWPASVDGAVRRPDFGLYTADAQRD